MSSLFYRLFRTAASPSNMSSPKEKVLAIIDENPVTVFSKSYCSYSRNSKKLLESLGAKYFVLELDEVADGAEMQDALQEITGQRSVPNIFIHKRHIGGNDDLQSQRGNLPKMLKQAGAVTAEL